MDDTQSPNAQLLETLRTQEFLKLEFARLARLIEAQQAELAAVRQSCTALTEHLDAMATGTLPYGLHAHTVEDKHRRHHLDAVHRDIRGAFYPPPSPLFLNPAFIRYRQLQRLDLRGQRIAVLTTAAGEYGDLLEATQANESIELRLHTINGPFTLIHRQLAAPETRHTHPGDIESAVLPLDACDLIWIPDPHLSSLALRCLGMLERLAERTTRHLLFSIRTEDWQEDDARMRAHRAGFTEVSRLLESGEDAYVTRFHEAKGYYVHSPRARTGETPGTQFLVASKIPRASFRLDATTEATDERR